MKWRVILELVGPDGIVGAHEVGGRAAVAEYAPRMTPGYNPGAIAFYQDGYDIVVNRAVAARGPKEFLGQRPQGHGHDRQAAQDSAGSRWSGPLLRSPT